PVSGQMQRRQPTEMELLQIALTNESGIDVIERIAALVRDARARQAALEFNVAMTAVQSEIERVVPDLENKQTSKKYESFVGLNKAVRPVYVKHGFSLTFGTADCPLAEHVRITCDVARGEHSKSYQVDVCCDGKGPKGGDVMTKADAEAAAMSRGRRYLVKMIFNIAVGQDDAGAMDKDDLSERLNHFAKCQTIAEVFEHFKGSYVEDEKAKDVKAQIELSEAKDRRKKEIQDARAKG